MSATEDSATGWLLLFLIHVASSPDAAMSRLPYAPVMAMRSFFTRTFCTQAKPDVLYRLVQLECRGHDQEVMRSYQKFVTLAAKELDITVGEA